MTVARTGRLASLPLVLAALAAPAFGQLSGTIDVADVGGAVPGVAFRGIDFPDFPGFSVSSAGDVNGDGLADMLIGAPYAASHAGETYLIYGSESLAGSSDLADADVTFRGINSGDELSNKFGDEAGFSVSSAGDVNGDGLADLLIGASSASPNDVFFAGETYLIYGSTSLANSFGLADADVTFRGIGGFGQAGYSVSSAGDVNGDGLADLLIGAPGLSPTAGETYLIYGSQTLTASFDLTAADVTFRSIDAEDATGNSVSSAGDVNGDGLADLLIGAAGAGRFNAGETYLVFGSTSLARSFDLAAADVTFGGIGGEHVSGNSVASAGDVNGDGLADLLIGAEAAASNGNSFVGKAYLVYGSASLGGRFDLAAADVIFSGTDAFDSLGGSVSSAGDVNGDGLADLLITAAGAGETYLIYGSESLSGSFDLAAADVTFRGIGFGPGAGRSISSAGDVNGDGLADLLIGASGAVPNGAPVGGAHLVYGQRVPEPASLALAGLAALGLTAARAVASPTAALNAKRWSPKPSN